MLLFDLSELQKIDKKINPHNYLLVETRLKLIIEVKIFRLRFLPPLPLP